MTIDTVREIIESDIEPDDDTLAEMFEATYGRQPDQEDWDAHLYSLICAGIDAESNDAS